MEEQKIKIERIDPATLTEFKPNYVKCIECGNITEFVCLSHSPAPFPVVKIDKDHYALLDTGEVFEYDHSENKSECYNSVRRTLSRLRAIINANCVDENKMRWVTLTYAENMTDSKQLYKDFEKFCKRFAYWCKKNGIDKPEYIAVAEPQGRGAWHMHIVWIFSNTAPFIANNEVLEPLWGHGFTSIKAVHGCDNIGAYFSAYLADMPLEDFQKAEIKGSYPIKYVEMGDAEKKAQEGTEGKRKAFVKGARLTLYPTGMNIYRCSRGIVPPVVTTISSDEYEKKKASAGTLTFSHACNVVSDSAVASDDSVLNPAPDSLIKNTILHEYYNIKRRKNQGSKE